MPLASWDYFLFLSAIVRIWFLFDEDRLLLVYHFPVALHVVDHFLRKDLLLELLQWLEWFSSGCRVLLRFLKGFSGLLLFLELLPALFLLFLDLSLFTLFLGLVHFASGNEFSH